MAKPDDDRCGTCRYYDTNTWSCTLIWAQRKKQPPTSPICPFYKRRRNAPRHEDTNGR